MHFTSMLGHNKYGIDIQTITIAVLLGVIISMAFGWRRSSRKKEGETFDMVGFLTAIFTGAGVIVASWAVIETDNTQYEMKRLDMVSGFESRYESLVYDDKDKVNVTNTDEVYDYNHRFWDLMYEEFSALNNGSIDPDTFSGWMKFRKEEWDTDKTMGAIDYRTAFTNSMKYLERPEFHLFMEQVYSGTNDGVFTNWPSVWQSWLEAHRAAVPNE